MDAGFADQYVITFGLGDDNLLSNFAPVKVRIWDKTFETAEHAYQYKKVQHDHPELAESIRAAKTPEEAREIGWSKPIDREYWDATRFDVMREILEAKYKQNKIVRDYLASTGDRALIHTTSAMEDHSNHFWSADNNASHGDNYLGKIWVALRYNLKLHNSR